MLTMGIGASSCEQDPRHLYVGKGKDVLIRASDSPLEQSIRPWSSEQIVADERKEKEDEAEPEGVAQPHKFAR